MATVKNISFLLSELNKTEIESDGITNFMPHRRYVLATLHWHLTCSLGTSIVFSVKLSNECIQTRTNARNEKKVVVRYQIKNLKNFTIN